MNLVIHALIRTEKSMVKLPCAVTIDEVGLLVKYRPFVAPFFQASFSKEKSMKTYKPKGKLYQLLAFISAIESVPGFSKLVFLNLAKHACDNDFTFIGQETLARLCSSSVRSVQRAIAQLEKLGLIRMKKMGRRKNYYLLVPEDPALLALAHKHGVPVPGSLQEQADSGQATERVDQTIHDNLSSIYAADAVLQPEEFSQEAVPAPASAPEKTATREIHDTAVPVDAQKASDLENEFSQLLAAYPRKEDAREAFTIFTRQRASLPPLNELQRIIEYEQRHNTKWQRGWAPYLKNWLRGGYEEAQRFMRLEEERLTAQARLMTAMLQVTAPLPVSAEQKPAPEPLPFETQEFDAVARLWGLNSPIATIAARGMWINKLNRGLRPSLQAAKAAFRNFSSLTDWLGSLGADMAVTPETASSME